MKPKSRNSRREMSKALSRVANASVSETLEQQKSIPTNITGAPGAGKSTLYQSSSLKTSAKRSKNRSYCY